MATESDKYNDEFTTEIKPDITHVEVQSPHDETARELDYGGLVKSRFDELSLLKTLWVFRRSAFYCFLVFTGYMCEGFELGAGGSVIANAGFIRQFGNTNSTATGSGDSTDVRALDPTWVSSWSALLNVGQLLTLTYVSWLADKFGRKAAFYVAWVWLVVGCVFLNTAKSPSVWALGKLCNGAGIGVIQITCQVYVCEISPNRIRGGLMVFQAVWSNVGGIIVSLMMQQLNQKHPDNYLIAMRVLWAPIGLIIIFWAFVPESPWWQARRGNKEGALKAMKQLYGNIEGFDMEEEYGIISRTIEHERLVFAKAPSFADTLRGLNRKRTLSIMILSACGQLGGLAIISTYSTYFFDLAGLDDPFLGSLILSCVNLASVIVWALTADKVGRRGIINICETSLCVILFIVGGLYWSGATDTVHRHAAAGTGLLVICCLWTFVYTIVALSQYLYAAELPSAMLRIRTGPITFVANSVLGIATCYATPPMLLSLGLKTAFVYAAFSVPCCILMWLYIPETKGRSAAEIDELYERRIPAWRWSKTITVAEEQTKLAIAGEKPGQAREREV